MNKTAVIWSAVTAFIIGLAGSGIAAVVEAKGNLPSAASWFVIIITALAVAAKDVRSLLKLPPVTNGDTAHLSKNASRLPLWLLGLALAGLLLGSAGCAASRPPTAWEQRFFTVTTNVVPVVTVEQPPAISSTNAAGEISETLPPARPVTNLVERYSFAPNQNAVDVQTTGTAIGSFWGAGGIVGTVLGSLFGLWALFRSRQAQLTATELAQIIETGRQVLLTLPDGAKYEKEWKDWMVKHQAKTDVIASVAQIVSNTVNAEAAKGAAQTIVNLIRAAK